MERGLRKLVSGEVESSTVRGSPRTRHHWNGIQGSAVEIVLTMLKLLRPLLHSSAPRQGVRGMAWMSRILSYQKR
jgi:hypothetical protein